MAPTCVLFVCTGNICRSPTAEAVLTAKADGAGLDLRIDSCGVSDEERGNSPDPRAVDEAARRGYVMPGRTARRIEAADFVSGLILAMTRDHLRALDRMAPEGARAERRLFLDAVPGREGQDVPDPWYGGAADFRHAFDLIEEGCERWLQTLRRGAA